MTAQRGFPTSEFTHRLGRAQAAMAARGFAGLLLTTEQELRYFTGFLTRFWESPSRPWYLVVPASGDPVAVIPSIGQALMARTWITDIRTWAAPDPEDDGTGLLADTLTELCGASGQVGVPFGPESHLRMPQADFRSLSSRLGGLSLVSDEGIMADLRSIKSEDEIAKIETACGIAGRAFARVPEIAAIGAPLEQVFRDFQRLCLEQGADWVPYLAGAAGPDGYEDVISPATETPLQAGDVLMLDTGAVWDGYFCDYDRNFAVGPASPLAREAHRLLVEAVGAACDIARAGAAASDLHAAMAGVLAEKTGGGRLGHGLGMQLTEGLSLIPNDHTELRPGMVITLEPGILTRDGRMMVHEENIVIQEGAPRRLSPFAGPDLQVVS